MRKIKTYEEFEWFKDLFKDSDDDRIAKGIIKDVLPKIDPETIQKIDTPGLSPKYIFSYNKSDITSILSCYYDFEGGGSDEYSTHVGEEELKCSHGLSKKIYKCLKNAYHEEQERLRIQKISTNTGL